MLQPVFKKWWLILIQGILLIFLSIYIYNNPVTVLAGISMWIGLLVLAAGAIGIVVWIAGDVSVRENMSLLWSVVTAALGLFMLLNVVATIKTFTILFGLWMLFTGLHLTQSGWLLKKDSAVGWVMILAGLISIVVSVMIIFNIGMGAVGISTLLGIQVLITGIALVLLSFAKRIFIGIMPNRKPGHQK